MKRNLKLGLLAFAACWSVGARSLHAQETTLFEDFNGNLSVWLQNSAVQPSDLVVERAPGDLALSLGEAASNAFAFDRDLTFNPGKGFLSFDLKAPVGSIPESDINDYLTRNGLEANFDLTGFATGEWETVVFETNRSASDPLHLPFQGLFGYLGTQNAFDVSEDILIDNLHVQSNVAFEPESSIRVLWYGQTLEYNNAIQQLALEAGDYDPLGDGSLEWDLDFWNPTGLEVSASSSIENPLAVIADPSSLNVGEDVPNFAEYDVLVLGSARSRRNFDFNADRLFANKEAIEAGRGSRTFLSGQDADAHYINRPGPREDGPLGFLVNAVNWAASGTGLGIVSLVADDNRWWLHEDSFLRDELLGEVSYRREERVVIPTETTDFPVNEGLTTGGLSNWHTSAHALFDNDIPGYLPINDSGRFPDLAVTIVTAGEAAGCTTNCDATDVPEPSFVFGLVAVTVAARFRCRS